MHVARGPVIGPMWPDLAAVTDLGAHLVITHPTALHPTPHPKHPASRAWWCAPRSPPPPSPSRSRRCRTSSPTGPGKRWRAASAPPRGSRPLVRLPAGFVEVPALCVAVVSAAGRRNTHPVPPAPSINKSASRATTGVYAGLRAAGKKADLSLVVADQPAAAAGVFTLNVMCAAPVTYCKDVLAKKGAVKAVGGGRGRRRLDQLGRQRLAAGDALAIRLQGDSKLLQQEIPAETSSRIHTPGADQRRPGQRGHRRPGVRRRRRVRHHAGQGAGRHQRRRPRHVDG
jgi:hypothetical protein